MVRVDEVAEVSNRFIDCGFALICRHVGYSVHTKLTKSGFSVIVYKGTGTFKALRHSLQDQILKAGSCF